MINFIADVGSNFGGSLDKAIEYIKLCKSIGVDIVKFQCWTPDDLFHSNHPAYKKIKSSKKPLGVPLEWHEELIKVANSENIIFSTTPTQPYHIDYLEKHGIEVYKIASGDITFYPLLDRINETEKPVILSTGMSTLDEIKMAVDRLYNCRKIVILHCVSLYPPYWEEINLKVIKTLKNEFWDTDIGISDHSEGIDIPVASVGFGVSYIEKHITISKNLKTPDAPFALTVEEFKLMIEKVRNIEKALGFKEKKPVNREIAERYWARRGIYAKRTIKKGELITIDKLAFLRPAKGITAEYFELILNKKARKDIKKGTPLSWEMIDV